MSLIFLLDPFMRYIIHKSQMNEISGRLLYLYDVFHLYFLPFITDKDYITCVPMGTNEPDVLFIIGHTRQSYDFLSENISNISEHCIVIVSCMGFCFTKFSKQKEIYVAAPNFNYCLLRNGNVFGFEFYISDAELDFYNASGSIKERIQAAFSRLK